MAEQNDAPRGERIHDIRAMLLALPLLVVLALLVRQVVDGACRVHRTSWETHFILAGGTFLAAVSISLLMRSAFRTPYLLLIRSELDRRQKHERWSLESFLALASYPNLAICATAPWPGCLVATVNLILLAAAFSQLYSSRQLARQIRQFTPAFDSHRRIIPKSMKRRVAFLLLLLFLLLNTVPVVSATIASLQSHIRDRAISATREFVGLIVNVQFEDTATTIVLVILSFVFVLGITIWTAMSVTLVVNVILHAHLSSLQGFRLALVREITGGTTLVLIAFALLGGEPLRPSASCLALGLLGWLWLTNDNDAIEKYLATMRQLF